VRGGCHFFFVLLHIKPLKNLLRLIRRIVMPKQKNLPKSSKARPFSRKEGHKCRAGGQDRLHPALSRIEFVELFCTARIEGHYEGYTLVFDGRNLLKQHHNSTEKIEPTGPEAGRFIQDLRIAVEHDPRIVGFLQSFIEHSKDG
jgi:hypothetical protein